MCFYYDEYAEVYREKDVKARKEHKCSECYKVIQKNELYKYIFTIFQGDASAIKICPVCQNKRQKIHDIEISRGCKEHEAWPPCGALMEYVHEYNLI